MSLQLFSPLEISAAVCLPADNRQVAEQLLAACIAEIKQGHRGQKILSANEGSPLARAKALLDEFKYERNFKIQLKNYDTGTAIREAAPQVQKEVFLMAMASTVKDQHGCWVTDRVSYELLKSMSKRKLPYDQSEILKILTLFMAQPMTISGLPMLSIISVVERYVKENGLSPSVQTALKKRTKEYSPTSYSAPERKIGLRIKELLDHASPPSQSGLRIAETPHRQVAQHAAPESQALNIRTGEAWTDSLWVELENLTAESRINWQCLLDHCRSAKSSKPTKKFLKIAKELLETIGHQEFVDVVCPTLASIGQPGECEKFNYGGHVRYGDPTQVHEQYVKMLRGLIWSTSLVDNETLIGVVGDAAEKCFQKIREIGPRCRKIGNACLIALSHLATQSAVAQLSRLKSRAKHISTRNQIAKAFQQAAVNAGMSEVDLVELGVPSFGMTELGILCESFGDFTATATIHANQTSKLTWENTNGKIQKSVPAQVKSEYADKLKSFKKKLKDIDQLIASIRNRIEQLFHVDRSWSMEDFRKRFLDHPLVGVVARRLIWTIETNELSSAAIWHEGKFVDANDQAIEQPHDQFRVTLWHPLPYPAQDVLLWRQWLELHRVSQPFKQAHREIYILTDAERETATYSNRFANHIIRQHQFATLCKQRGWHYNLQGEWDSWNVPYLDLPQYHLRVEFFVEPQEGLKEITDALVYTHLATDQLRFLSIDDNHILPPVLLAKVPSMIFSEIMRDIDLFVAAASIGNDPTGHIQLAGSGFADYWKRFSFGDLSGTSITRKQTLEKVIPRLKIAPKCRIEGKYLVVAGQLRSYKIHLGSGNVLMSPNDQYLCVVQKRGSGTKRTDNIFLPFEGDNTLALILSKAFLLAEDDRIKDHSILNQIRMDH